MPELTTPEVAEQVGATYRQLDHWCRRGFLHIESCGAGRRRHWPAAELAAAASMAQLVAAGLTPAAAARVVRGQPLAPGITVQVSTP